MGHLYFFFVGQLNMDAVCSVCVCCAGTVDLKEVTGAAGVCDGMVSQWGWDVSLRRVYIVTTMLTCQCSIRPKLSHNFGSVGVATIHRILVGGVTFVAIVWESAVLAVMILGTIKTVCPTVVGVVVLLFAFSVGISVGQWLVRALEWSGAMMTSLAVSCCVSSLLVVVRSASILRPEAVAVARLANASVVWMTNESMALFALW
jgi:hypothetical protein